MTSSAGWKKKCQSYKPYKPVLSRKKNWLFLTKHLSWKVLFSCRNQRVLPGMCRNQYLRYSLVIDGEVVRQWDEDTQQVQQISLSKNPAFQAVIEQMKQWFSGTYTSLLAEYDIKLLKQRPLSLSFVPHKNTVASNVINNVTVVFRDDERYIHQICIEEKSGDSTFLTFVDTLLNCSNTLYKLHHTNYLYPF